MKTVRMALLVAALTAASVTGASARTHEFDQRVRDQQMRIERGLRTGQITRAEAARLRHNLYMFRAAENRAMADGHLSAMERFRLNRQLDRQSLVIHRLRHNGRTVHDTSY